MQLFHHSMGDVDNTGKCYLCLGASDNDCGVDADGYGYHASCEAKRQARISAGLCWACNEPIKKGDEVSDYAHAGCLDKYGHGEYVGY